MAIRTFVPKMRIEIFTWFRQPIAPGLSSPWYCLFPFLIIGTTELRDKDTSEFITNCRYDSGYANEGNLESETWYSSTWVCSTSQHPTPADFGNLSLSAMQDEQGKACEDVLMPPRLHLSLDLVLRV